MQNAFKVLIVDDEALLAMALADELSEEGLDIAGPYGTATAAFAALEKDCPDIALLDVNLGRGRTSYELAEELTKRGTPVVFLTGYSELKPDKQQFLDAGVLAKPVSIEQVMEQVELFLN